jgi:cytosine/adenosine deaminase-related metal-dependent hydrolase
MKKLVIFTLGVTLICAQDRPVVLKTSTLFDGRGKTLKNTIIVIEGSKIASVGGKAPANAITYDLTAFTVSPGWIDTFSSLGERNARDARLIGAWSIWWLTILWRDFERTLPVGEQLKQEVMYVVHWCAPCSVKNA